ncbi:MAG: dTMP kinase [Eubacteriales bacterium]|jgi:dTMP kinase|nr:dTMP kinase [Bacillota bacterium]MBV1727991.1 dTMP kinase [Desulforudis sp.]MDP3049768.1 dTMP kinase [Eubacteriales bacterium]MDQ7790161.1 dTMP kinase [Clostridia bacterium]MBU4532968.1 dTMP kinase [Bacillota bacterium]
MTFIVFEGIDGVGKTTQINLLQDRLTAAGLRVLVTREPGGTRLGEIIRGVLLNPVHSEMAPETESLLYVAARAQFVREVVRPALADGMVVLSDRYADSTLAYQGYGRRLDVARLGEINGLATGDLHPALTVLLDLPVEAALARTGAKERDRLEQETGAFYQRVRDGYLALAGANPEQYLVLDAVTPPEELAAVIWERVGGMLHPVQ